MTRLAIGLDVAVAATGCASRCKEVERARAALAARRGDEQRGPDVRVTVPFQRANTLVAELLEAEPLAMPLEPPDLGPIEIEIPALVAEVREVQLVAGGEGKVRIATRVAVRQAGEAEIAMLAMVAEVTPVVRPDALLIGLGPENILAMKPELGGGSAHALGDAIARWLPERIRARAPRVVIDLAAKRLASYLTGAAFRAMQRTLLRRVGEVTALRLRLPDVPVKAVAMRSSERALEVEIRTDLPVRRGLGPRSGESVDIAVRVSASAAAELANWAIDRGHAPRWYDRNLEPRAHGEFRPRFDYVAEDRAHPLKVFAFQERGGCSYFRVGVRASVAIEGDKLRATALDRVLEASAAHPLLEIGAWVKFFVAGWVDQTKRVAAHTQLKIGTRVLETRVVAAALVEHELQIALQVAAKAPSTAPLARRMKTAVAAKMRSSEDGTERLTVRTEPPVTKQRNQKSSGALPR